MQPRRRGRGRRSGAALRRRRGARCERRSRGARAELAIAASKIPNLPNAQGDAWRRLATAISVWPRSRSPKTRSRRASSTAIRCSPRSLRDRARYGAPKGALKPDVEGAAVTATKHALELVGSSKLGDASRAIGDAERRFPKAAGPATARCNLDLSQGAVEPARAACARALARDPDDSFALYLSAILAFRNDDAASTRAGIDKLKHAIEVDPDLGQAWRALGKGYERAHDDAAHAELAKRYQEKFKQSL